MPSPILPLTKFKFFPLSPIIKNEPRTAKSSLTRARLRQALSRTHGRLLPSLYSRPETCRFRTRAILLVAFRSIRSHGFRPVRAGIRQPNAFPSYRRGKTRLAHLCLAGSFGGHGPCLRPCPSPWPYCRPARRYAAVGAMSSKSEIHCERALGLRRAS